MSKIPWIICGILLILLINLSQLPPIPVNAQPSLESRLNRLETTLNGLQTRLNSLESRLNQPTSSPRTSPPRTSRNLSPITPQMFDRLTNLVIEINQRLKRVEQKFSQLKEP